MVFATQLAAFETKKVLSFPSPDTHLCFKALAFYLTCVYTPRVSRGSYTYVLLELKTFSQGRNKLYNKPGIG